MVGDKDIKCQYQFRDSVKYSNSNLLIASYAVNAIVTLASNFALIVGLRNTTRSKKYTRNEKLVIVLTIIDILNTLVVSSSQTILLRQINNFSCLDISMITFFRVWFLGISGCTFLMISIERYLTVFYNNKICGIYIKDSYFVGYFVFIIFFTFCTAVLYGVVFSTSNMHLQFMLHIGTGCFTFALLSMIIATNVLLLFKTKEKLRNNSLRAQRNTEIENYITKTVVIISLANVLFYTPCLAAQCHLSYTFSKDLYSLIPSVHRIFMWTLVIREIGPWLNALIYALRNRRIYKMYFSKINFFFRSNSVTVSLVQETSSVSKSTSMI
ncbi:uncharacterized protein LOC124810260 [Hydra vulgaris]|uniref:Uncharacterized protein LOC124810260 n=1 Tax=Hydra vulgaris TaxID=6087 RepID=A0ABM4DKM6_HYDVU